MTKIHEDRIKLLNSELVRKKRCVLYWMQASQRTRYNHALEYAIAAANKLNRPLIVFFGIIDNYPEANERHYCFLLEGLKEVQASLQARNIGFAIQHVSPELGVAELSKEACIVVTDRGYLKIQKRWREYVAEHIRCPLIQVESDVIVPVEQASTKEEYSAATFRPKIERKLHHYMVPMQEGCPQGDSEHLDFGSFEIQDLDRAISRLRIDRSVKRVASFRGGTAAAQEHLESFLKEKIDLYQELRKDPTRNCLSNLSPYLHFGQISPLYVALRVLETDSHGKDAYLEELIVRRELSVNFVHYNPNYDSFDGIPQWAKKTLLEHQSDPQEYIYSLDELEEAATHDPYWNAAQKEMRTTGKMHGYMRMYWGKKILEWTENPRQALKRALYLNNKYELDGRDPNGFTGVAWCFGKHDRPWKERRIFGKVRYMNDKGLKRKFQADKYVEKVEEMSHRLKSRNSRSRHAEDRGAIK